MNQSTVIQISLMIYTATTLIGMAPMNLGIGLVALVSVITLLTKKSPRFPDQKTNWGEDLRFSWPLILACLLSTLFALWMPIQYAGHTPTVDFHSVLKLAHFLFPSILFYAFLSSREDQQANLIERILWASWITLLLLTPFGIGQFFYGWYNPQVIPTSRDYFHVTLFFGHHLSTASILIFPTFAALSVAAGAAFRKERPLRIEWLIGVSGIALLFLTFARTAWLTLPIGIAMILIRFKKKRTVKANLTIAGITTALITIALLCFSTSIRSRLSTYEGIGERFQIWKVNIAYFVERPFTGIGFLKTQEMSPFYYQSIDPENYHRYLWGHAHSNLFETLGGTGMLGMIGFFIWVIYTFRLANRVQKLAREKNRPRWADVAYGFTIALTLLHINGLTNVNFWEGKVFHLQMWAVAVLLMMKSVLFQKIDRTE